MEQHFLRGIFGILALAAELMPNDSTVPCNRASARSTFSASPFRSSPIARSSSERTLSLSPVDVCLHSSHRLS